MEPLAAFFYTAIILALVVMIDVAVTLRGLRVEASRLRVLIERALYYFMFVRPEYPHETHHRFESGFCIWVFRGGKWCLEANYCEEGYEPGPPPRRTNVMEGYAIRQLGVKRRPH